MDKDNAAFKVRAPETLSMRTRDGVRLDADLYVPDAPGPFPVLLVRTDRDRRTAAAAMHAHPSWYAAQGYLVAVQDVRGTGSSEGEFIPFAFEAADGADAAAWAAGLPGSDGKVGMYGAGYAGAAALLALAAGAPGLKAACPALAPWDPYRDWAFDGGAFQLAANMRWTLETGAVAAWRRGDEVAYHVLSAAAVSLPLGEEVPARPRILREYGRCTRYDDWLANSEPGPFWEALSAGAMLGDRRVDAAVLHFGGWYDRALEGTLAAWSALSARSSAPQHLVVGPWADRLGARRVGQEDFGPETVGRVDLLQTAWFDHFLKGVESGIEDRPAVELFDLRGKRWRGYDTFPEGLDAVLHLGSTGLAAAATDDGLLLAEPADWSVDTIVHDPLRPAPAVGGHAAPDPGLFDRACVDERADVACYTTAPFIESVQLSGRVELELHVEADQPCFDVSAVLTEVTPEGRSLVLTQGHARVGPETAGMPLRIPMRATCAMIMPGNALRLSIAGAAFPAYPVNPGTGAEAAETRRVDCQPVTLGIHAGRGRPSRLLLTVVPG